MTTEAQIKARAIEWVLRLAQPGNPPLETAIAFQAWLVRSPRHLRAYLRYDALVHHLDTVGFTNQIDAGVTAAPPPRRVRIDVDRAIGCAANRGGWRGASELADG